MSANRVPRIHVLAGVNGAGKSSIGGAAVRQHGGGYFNPDEASRTLMTANPTMTQAAANSTAWHVGVRLLRHAIKTRLDFVFETTLGGNTITRLLTQAASHGFEIHVWYVGLSSLELHIARVQSRVRRGGHDIPAAQICQRYEHSRLNLIELLPHLATLRVYDNSAEADPDAGRIPKPTLVLQMEQGKICQPPDLSHTPHWAKPIVAAALKMSLP